jgi:hypothetical protein
MDLYTDQVFASIDHDLVLERIAGGNETEVYRTDDQRYVVKVKGDLGGSVADALNQVRSLRAAAEQFAVCLGPQHSLPSYYLIALDSTNRAQVVVIQPYAGPAKPLYEVDYAQLSMDERRILADQLRDVIRRSLRHYRLTGSMPDLYGRTSSSPAERTRMKAIGMLPQRIWSFLVQRNLLRSHNLLLRRTEGSIQIVLVDYDPVRRSKLYRAIYYFARWILLWRDHVLILLMRRSKASAP